MTQSSIIDCDNIYIAVIILDINKHRYPCIVYTNYIISSFLYQAWGPLMHRPRRHMCGKVITVDILAHQTSGHPKLSIMHWSLFVVSFVFFRIKYILLFTLTP